MNNEFTELIDFILNKYNIEHEEEDIDNIMKSYGLMYNSKFKEIVDDEEVETIQISHNDLKLLKNNGCGFYSIDINLDNGSKISIERGDVDNVLVFDDKEENKAIEIPLSEEDLQQLQNNETFDWCFDGVDVHLYKGEEEDY